MVYMVCRKIFADHTPFNWIFNLNYVMKIANEWLKIFLREKIDELNFNFFVIAIFIIPDFLWEGGGDLVWENLA